MKLTTHRFSLQCLTLVAALHGIGGSSIQAQPHNPEDGLTKKQPQTPPQAAPRTELPFRISDGYLILVEGEIGTRKRLKFLLDTGASMSIVDSKIADGLKLHREPAQSFNFDRKLTWEQAAIPEVRFGPISAINTVMLVGSLAKYSEFARNVDAIVGLDLLQLRDFTVDYATKKIVFHSAGLRLDQSQNPALSNSLTLQIRVQGRPVRLIVDTGFPGILLFEERLRATVPELAMTRDALDVTLGDRLRAKKAILHGVAIGPTSRDLSVLLAKAPPPEMLPGIDGVAGIAALNARRVHISFSESTLTWE